MHFYWFIFSNFTGQFKCGTWTSVTRCVKLLKSYCCLLFIYPVKFIPYWYTNKCRYQLKRFLKMKVSLFVFQALLISIFSSPKPPKLWSTQLRSRKSLPPQLLHPPKKSLFRCRPLRSLSLLLLLPRCLLKKMSLPRCWRITSHIWDQSLVLTTGSSTPPEESLVWSSTDELACRSSLSMSIHPPFLLLF